MSLFRVIKRGDRGYEFQRKGWWFWSSCHSTSVGFAPPAPCMPLFGTLEDAKAFITRTRAYEGFKPHIVYDEENGMV